MSTIAAIDITHHQLVLDPPFPASWDPQPRTRFPVTIVRVRDSAGRVGVGSGDAMYGFADYARWFVRAIRDAVGPALTLMVDCNQGWRMPWDTQAPWHLDHATEVALALQHEGVYWMEEPLHRGDYAAMGELRQRVREAASGESPMLIAGGEMTREPYEFNQLLEHDCLDVFQPDVVCTQGFAALASLGRRVVADGKVFTPHTWGNGIGVLANLQLTAGAVGHQGSRWVEYPLDPPEWAVERRDYPFTRPIDTVRGEQGMWVELGERPGLGIDLDEQRLAATASASATFS